MTKSEILIAAHKQAREFRRLYPSYREAFSDNLKAVYASVGKPAPEPRGFQVVEPWYKRAMYDRRVGGWR